MFDKVQESLKKSKDERQKKRLEKERVRLEKAAAEAVREKERLQQEAEKIQAEKDRLLSLDDKGLMVELILAVRGLYSQMEYIQSQQAACQIRHDRDGRLQALYGTRAAFPNLHSLPKKRLLVLSQCKRRRAAAHDYKAPGAV